MRPASNDHYAHDGLPGFLGRQASADLGSAHLGSFVRWLVLRWLVYSFKVAPNERLSKKHETRGSLQLPVHGPPDPSELLKSKAWIWVQ